MIKFLIKKTFFDMWDNLATIFIFNLGFVLIIAGCKLLTIEAITNLTPLWFMIAFGIIAIFSVYSGIVSSYCKDIANYEKIEISKLLKYLKKTYVSSLLMSIVVFVYTAAIMASLYYYGSQSHFVSRIAVYFVFMINLIVIFSLQFFYSFQATYGGSPISNIKRSLSFFMGNIRFSLVVFLGSCIIMVLSAVTIFVMFGITTIFLWLASAVKLRMYKYDFLEENPESTEKDINWYILLKRDRAKVGKRTFKSFLYPWKA